MAKAFSETETGCLKDEKLARYDLIPDDVLRALAEHYGRGAQKYPPRNWEKGQEFGKNFAAAQRHLWAWWGGEDTDPENGAPHLVAAAWNIFALLYYAERFPEYDDRPDHP